MDAAIAPIDKANQLDATDATVQQWLPKLEVLANVLPAIKALDTQIASKPKDPVLLLDQAIVFTSIAQPSLALSNARRPPALAPGRIRARIQAGEAKSPSTLAELFLPGTEPREDASSFFSSTGALLLPPEYAAWCATPHNTLGAQVRPEPRILSPHAGAHYRIDPILSRSQQMLELTSTLTGSV